jgi:FMN phosphatase YigB (HAD superfamily)
MIKHIWFDFSGTLTKLNEAALRAFQLEVYSEVIGEKISKNLEKEFFALRDKHKSTSAVFHSLGKPGDFWSKKMNEANFEEIYIIAQPNLPEVLGKIKQLCPISLFANIDPSKILNNIGISESLFTHIIKAGMFERPKPYLDGFYKMLEVINLLPEEILYVGDIVEKDVLPAQSLGIKTGLMWAESNQADYCFRKFEDILNILV